MAVIKFSALVSEIRGKVSGQIIKGCRSGFALQNKPSPLFISAPSLQLEKSIFQFIAICWKNLAPADRLQWEVEAATGRFGYYSGGIIPLSGQEAFYKFNILAANYNRFHPAANFEFVQVPLPSSIPTVIVAPVISANEGGNTLILTTDGAQPTIAGDRLILYFSRVFASPYYFEFQSLQVGYCEDLAAGVDYQISSETMLQKKCFLRSSNYVNVGCLIINRQTVMITPIQLFPTLIT